jgi:hypothetical protein
MHPHCRKKLNLNESDQLIMIIKDEVKKDIYSVYSAIFETKFDLQKKKILLTSLIGAYEWSWLVVGISEKALAELEVKKFKYTPGIVRAHIVARIDTAKEVFQKLKLTEEEFFEHILANDKTVLTLKSENKTRKPLPDVFPISSVKILFQCQNVGYKYKNEEETHLENLHKDTEKKSVSAISLK